MLKKWLMKIFKLESTVVCAVEFSPIKRDVDKNVLFLNPVISRERYNYVYNVMVSALSEKNYTKFETLQELLSSIKILSNNH
jgi:hypothetical protein